MQRILAQADLQPHKSRYWLHSDDPDFEAKVWPSAGCTWTPRACTSTASWCCAWTRRLGIQALEPCPDHGRARAGRSGGPRSTSGTARRCLLATLVVPTGQVIGGVTQRRATWDYVRHVRDVVEQFPDARRSTG